MGPVLVRFEFLGSELTGEGPTPVGKLHGRFLSRIFFRISELTEEDTPLRWAKVGMNLHVFAWIFAICEFCDFPLKGRFHAPFCTHLGLLETWRISNKQTETAGTTAACCFKGTPSSSLLVAG